MGLSNCLQSVLRAAARFVLGLPGRAPVMSAIRDALHWLTYPQRVTFKLCLTMYNVDNVPVWPGTTLSHQILYTTYRRGRPHATARSADQHKLFVPRTSTSTPRWVLGRSAHRAHLRGTSFLGSFATQPSPSTSSDNPSKPICLTVFNCVHVLWALSPHALS